MALWSEKMLCNISMLWILLRLALWPNVWPILENVQCALEKKLYLADVGWSVWYMCMRSIWLIVAFSSSVSLFSFFLDVLSFTKSGVLKSPTTIVELSISLFRAVRVCFMYFGALLLGV